jgi:putative membrane protein
MAGIENPYKRFSDTDLILRDHLAIDRTTLANERTFLAYIRTALSFSIVGATCIKFLTSRLAVLGGWALIAVALILIIVGIWRYRQVHHRISVVQSSSGDL